MAHGQKRSLRIAGHATSVALEPEFWRALEEIAEARGTSLGALIAEIDRVRAQGAAPRGLASTLRVFVLETVRTRSG